MPKLDLEKTQPPFLEQAEAASDVYCEHCPMWGQCSVCGSDHPRYLLLKSELSVTQRLPFKSLGKERSLR